MGVQEGERVTGGHGGSQQPSGDESFSLSLADNSNNVQLLQILIQPVLQVIWKYDIHIRYRVKRENEKNIMKSRTK